MAPQRFDNASASQVRIGCCGFPEPLVRYERNFQLAEVQQTFYQPPQLKTLEKWRTQVPADFEFTLKAWQLITHESTSPTYRRLREKLSERQLLEAGAFRASEIVMSAWKRTLECAQALGSHLILFQCPARFGPTSDHKTNLREFFHAVRKDLTKNRGAGDFILVWEPRGEWKPEEIRGLAEELNLAHAVDPFEQMPVTQGLGYFRLHGKRGYCYQHTDEDLERLHAVTRDFQPCYVLFNNISMHEDARRFARLTANQEPR
jgi:uncharacterized protein YecE (DUF72 family)